MPVQNLLIGALIFSATMAHATYGRGNQDQRCFKHSSQPVTPKVIASFKSDDDVRSEPLILPDGRVVIGSVDHSIYFLNADATVAKKYTTPAGVNCSAALTHDNKVVIGAGDGNVYFFDANGNKLSSFETKASVFAAPSVMKDGTIVVGSQDNTIYFLGSDGHAKASYSTKGPIRVSAAQFSDGTVVVSSEDGSVYFLNTKGALLASFAVGAVPWQPVITPDDHVIFGAANGNVYRLDSKAQGGVIYNTKTTFFGPSLTLPNGNIAISTLTHQLNVLQPNGNLLTSLKTSGSYAGTPVLLNPQTIVAGANDNMIHFLNLSGTELTTLGPLGPLEKGQAFLQPVTVGNDGTLVSSSADGHVYFVSTDPGVTACP